MFLSKKTNNKWSVPINLGFPINSPDDDERLAPALGGKKFYFSALRPDGYLTFGQSDIYEINVVPASKYDSLIVGPAYNRPHKPKKSITPLDTEETADVPPAQPSKEAEQKPAIDTLIAESKPQQQKIAEPQEANVPQPVALNPKSDEEIIR